SHAASWDHSCQDPEQSIPKEPRPVKHCRKRRLGWALASRNDGRTSPWPWRGRRIVLTRCAEIYPLLPQTRIDHGRSSDRLRNAGLCHFFFHLAEGGVAKCSFLIFLYHNPVIMTRAARRETVNSDQVSRILELCC